LFNDKLSWSSHFENIVRKLSQRLYVLRILKPIFSHDKLILVFNAIILSVIDYASPVFLNCGVGLNSKLLAICKRAFRVIHGYDVSECKECHMSDILNRRKTLAMKLFKTALFDKDHILHDLLPQVSRRSHRLTLPHVRTTRRMESFILHCAILYNETL
jgi:hypothetical protein